jgi:hypothetical protein
VWEPLAALADRHIDHMAQSPSEAFTSPIVLQLLLDGYLDAPRFDPDDLEAMLDAVPLRTLWTDDRVAVYGLTPAELRDLRPELFAGR